MSRPVRVLLISSALIAVAALASACGSQHILVAKGDPLYHGAVLFNQRCAGCHTFSYAATNGSAANVRTKQYNNGPNFDIRCERPVDRVLYAIENGGFSGGIMPQNIVVGQDAIEVAKFVATYSGTHAPHATGVQPCAQQPIGTLPAAASSATTAAATPPTATTTTSTTAAPAPAKAKPKAARRKKKKK